MVILVINAGSSSLKYQLIDMGRDIVLAKGLCDRIGLDGAIVKQTAHDGRETIRTVPMKNHSDAIVEVVNELTGENCGVIAGMDEISAVGHRVVHGGEKFFQSVVIDDEVMKAIEATAELAPIHNPPNITGIRACQEIMPGKPQVAVFDTAFHQTIPDFAYMYALPYEYYQKYQLRKYGFHGTSHKYVSERAAAFLGKPVEELKIVTCHLGNGSSIAAVDGGKVVDTTMGFTPLDGLAMGTRCGTIDPAVVTFLMKKEGIDAERMDVIMNKQSGMLGVSGVSSDFRDLHKAMDEHNERARLALSMFCYQVRKKIGAYAAAMDGLDAIVFTAGVGENNPYVRYESTIGLDFMGVAVDEAKNNERGGERDVSADNARVRTLVIPTNEELAIAREPAALVG
jgi:acetate kinase